MIKVKRQEQEIYHLKRQCNDEILNQKTKLAHKTLISLVLDVFIAMLLMAIEISVEIKILIIAVITSLLLMNHYYNSKLIEGKKDTTAVWDDLINIIVVGILFSVITFILLKRLLS